MMSRNITFGKSRPPRAVSHESAAADPLTQSQLRELQRRLRDLDDRRRYLLISVFTPRFVLYYDVSSDTFGMNDPSLGTLFKRRAAAIAIQRLLREAVQLVPCRVDRRNRVVKRSLRLPRRSWRGPRRRPQRRRAAAERRA